MPHAAADMHRSLPFFDFMLYGVKSFSLLHGRAHVTCVVRGRKLTLVSGDPAVGSRESPDDGSDAAWQACAERIGR